MSEGPLSRYTVLDLTIARAGPTAVRLLADWGARVIKIEPPAEPNASGGSITGGRAGPDEQNLHRNKRGLSINLKSERGQQLFMTLARQADVVVENFRSDVKHRLGVDYDSVRKANPSIIYASISGFGQDGPYAARPGVDQIVQGMSGLMSITGKPEHGPTRVGIAISDTTAGMFLGQGILLALLHREHTGEGQWVHTSLLEGMLSKLDFQGARYTMKGEIPTAQGNDHPTQIPMGTFRAKDGQVNIAAPTSRMWERLCTALNAEALRSKAGYETAASRSKRRDEIRSDINAVTEQFTTAELVARLNDAGVPCGPINNIGEAFEDPQVQHLRMSRPAAHAEFGDINLLRSPINLSAFPHAEQFHHPGPIPGEHNHEVLREFGYADADIIDLEQAGVI